TPEEKKSQNQPAPFRLDYRGHRGRLVAANRRQPDAVYTHRPDEPGHAQPTRANTYPTYAVAWHTTSDELHDRFHLKTGVSIKACGLHKPPPARFRPCRHADKPDAWNPETGARLRG